MEKGQGEQDEQQQQADIRSPEQRFIQEALGMGDSKKEIEKNMELEAENLGHTPEE